MLINNAILHLPYGLSSFRDIRQEGLAYVDKTNLIEALEQSSIRFPLFLRPRRFGKTLITTMLMEYYDRASAKDFDELFASTYIHAHPTPLQGKLYVLRLDFSGIDSSQACRGFIEKLLIGIRNFFDRYPVPESDEFISAPYNTPSQLFRAFCLKVAAMTGRKLYVIIDEYDQFANEILSSDKELFRKITSSDGFLKNFYANLKEQTASGIVSRIFITGVTSLSLDSISSGFGIQKNITQLPAFASAAGFTESELRHLIEQTMNLANSGMTPETLISRMRDYYNGYRFSPQSPLSVYNASMCLYYLSALQDTGEEPPILLDPSFSVDISKIRNTLSLSDPALVRRIVDAALHGQNITLPSGSLTNSVNLNSLNQFDEPTTLSVLFFMGFLTFSTSRTQLRCPNKAILGQFFEYFFKTSFGSMPTFDIDALPDIFKRLSKGSCAPLLRLVSETLQKTSGLHLLSHFSESSLQVAIKFALLTNQDTR